MIGFPPESKLENLGVSATSPLIFPTHSRLTPPHLRTNHIFEIRYDIKDQIAVRHADAEHNELGIFNGSPNNKDQFGLTKKGREVVFKLIPSLQSWIDQSGKPLLIIHSDFRRAREMAEIIAEGLGKNSSCKLEQRIELRERDPGKLEGLAYRSLLAKFGFHVNESESESSGRGKLKRAISLLHKSNVLAMPSEQLLGLEPVRAVENRTTKLVREIHNRQQLQPQLVLYIGHEFSLGPLLNAFLGRPAGMFWTNRHIPRAKPFKLSVNTARRHFIEEVSLPSFSELEAA